MTHKNNLRLEIIVRSPLPCTNPHFAAVVALVADIGEPCWASGSPPAALHGFDGFELRAPFHITTARDRNVRRIGHVVHTTTDLQLIDRDTKRGLPVLSATRTLIDISRSVKPALLTTAVDSALRDGATSEEFLHRRIAALRTSGRPGLLALLGVLEGAEIIRGGQSWLERETLRLLDAAGLPRPSTQVVLGRRGDRLIRVDFLVSRYADRGRGAGLSLASHRCPDENRCGASQRATAPRIRPTAVHLLRRSSRSHSTWWPRSGLRSNDGRRTFL